MSINMSPQEAQAAIVALKQAVAEQGAINTELRTALETVRAANEAMTRQVQDAQRVDPGQGDEGLYLRRTGDHAVALRFTGCKTDEDGWMPGLVDATAPSLGVWHDALQRQVEEHNILSLHAKATPGLHAACERRKRSIARHLQRGPAAIAQVVRSLSEDDLARRVFGDSAGIGGEWIPTNVLPMVEREASSPRLVEALLAEMPMSSAEVKNPYLNLTGLQPFLYGTATTDDVAAFPTSSLSTDERTIVSKGLAVHVKADRDASEDAVIDFLPLLRQELVTALQDGREDAIINGDTAATHQDAIATWSPRSRWANSAAGLGGPLNHRRAWQGWRARAYDVSSGTVDHSAKKTAAGALELMGMLAAPHSLGATAFITSPEYFITMLGFDEVLTVDKMGPRATILTGQLASLYGRPVIVTDFITKDLATTGLYTGTGATTGLLCVDTSRFFRGVRRAQRLEMETDISRGLMSMVASWRGTMKSKDADSKRNVAWAFNL